MTVIGIGGASGKLGRRTAQYVLASHPANEVVLFSRTSASLTEFTNAGATARHADFDQPDALADAFSGVDVLLLISTTGGEQRVVQHKAAIAAASAAGVDRIVYTSMSNPGKDFPAAMRPLAGVHAATEEALRAAGPAWTVLRNALYVDGLAGGWTKAAGSGQLLSNNGSGRHAPVTRDDCAAAAAAVLLGQGHDNAVYDIAGPRLLDDDAIAAALADSYGRPVEVVGVPDDEYREGLVASGVPAGLAAGLAGFGASIRAGLLETPLGDTQKLIDRAPVDISQFFALAPTR